MIRLSLPGSTLDTWGLWQFKVRFWWGHSQTTSVIFGIPWLTAASLQSLHSHGCLPHASWCKASSSCKLLVMEFKSHPNTHYKAETLLQNKIIFRGTGLRIWTYLSRRHSSTCHTLVKWKVNHIQNPPLKKEKKAKKLVFSLLLSYPPILLSLSQMPGWLLSFPSTPPPIQTVSHLHLVSSLLSKHLRNRPSPLPQEHHIK